MTAQPPQPPMPLAPPIAPASRGRLSALPVPAGVLASPARRFGGYLLSGLLLIGTLVIGYVVWSIIAWTRSQTPAKQVLGMRVVDAHTGAPASFGRMVMREIVWSIVLALGSAVTAGILGLVDGLYVFGETRQRLLDRMAHTLVVRI